VDPADPGGIVIGEKDGRAFGPEALGLDPGLEVERIGRWLRHVLARDLRRRGLVVAMSGGIDSTVTAALAVRALGRERVFGLLLPERQSDSETLPLSLDAVRWLGIAYEHQDITPVLEALSFYTRYDAAVRRVIPDYGPGWRSKIVAADATAHAGFTFFTLQAEGPSGEARQARLPLAPYLEIVAATSFKQRVRKMLEYYHADRLHYAVAGTPNRLEYDQGFFVKNGDGAADVKPIAHLYKSQVYQLAEYFELPAAIRRRRPTTDTYSLAQGQDEFYFGLPYDLMDLCLYAKNQGVAADQVAAACGLTVEQVGRVWADIDTKRSTTRYLRLPPLLAAPVPEVPG
jgi:NAD+ synthase